MEHTRRRGRCQGATRLSHVCDPRRLSGKESAWSCRRRKPCGFNPWAGKIPWRRKRQPTPVLYPGQCHEHSWNTQRNLGSCSPWGHRVGHDLVTEHALVVYTPFSRPSVPLLWFRPLVPLTKTSLASSVGLHPPTPLTWLPPAAQFTL